MDNYAHPLPLCNESKHSGTSARESQVSGSSGAERGGSATNGCPKCGHPIKAGFCIDGGHLIASAPGCIILCTGPCTSARALMHFPAEEIECARRCTPISLRPQFNGVVRLSLAVGLTFPEWTGRIAEFWAALAHRELEQFLQTWELLIIEEFRSGRRGERQIRRDYRMFSEDGCYVGRYFYE